MCNEWIKVTDRLPEYTTRLGNHEMVCVIAYLNSGIAGKQGLVCESLYCDGRWEVLNIKDYNAPVTHWMPLPNPPSE